MTGIGASTSPGDLADRTGALLLRSSRQLREAGLPGDACDQLERLATQVHEACVVAVVGRVKAGKSTFINALLGEDLAKTGTTETTATINFFRHGQADPARPVRCHWRDGRVTDESRAFLDSLQGNDEETLRRSIGISHLEFRLPNPALERVTLVDTPGTGSAVELHEDQTSRFMGLTRELRERHDQETRRLASEADAAIYLVGPTAGAGDQALLDAFSRLTGGQSRPINAIGVLARIDIDPALLARRDELAAGIAARLRTSLNLVVPVSAGLRRALDQLAHDAQRNLTALREALLTVPPALLTGKLLASEEFWVDWEHPDCPLSCEEREDLLGDMPWSVFATIAHEAATAPSVDVAAARLDEMAGFAQLSGVLERRFLSRGRFLRIHRIVNDARAILQQSRREHHPHLRQEADQRSRRLDRYLSFIRAAGGDPQIAAELAALVQEHFTGPSPEAALDAVDRSLAGLYWELEDHNAEAEALQQIADHPDLFEEIDELRTLFGLYDRDLDRRLSASAATADDAASRQHYWRRVEAMARDDVRRDVAGRAVYIYGKVLDAMLTGGA